MAKLELPPLPEPAEFRVLGTSYGRRKDAQSAAYFCSSVEGGSLPIMERYTEFQMCEYARAALAQTGAINYGTILDALDGLPGDVRPEVEHLAKLIRAFGCQIGHCEHESHPIPIPQAT